MSPRLVFKGFGEGEVEDILKNPYIMKTDTVSRIFNIVGINNVIQSSIANDEREGDIIISKNPDLSFEEFSFDVLNQMNDILDLSIAKKIGQRK